MKPTRRKEKQNLRVKHPCPKGAGVPAHVTHVPRRQVSIAEITFTRN